MPVVRTQADDGSCVEAPQFALDQGFTGDSYCVARVGHLLCVMKHSTGLRLSDAICVLQPEVIRYLFASGISGPMKY
jgi:hypothetical protein